MMCVVVPLLLLLSLPQHLGELSAWCTLEEADAFFLATLAALPLGNPKVREALTSSPPPPPPLQV
jgi:hypothetical protein